MAIELIEEQVLGGTAASISFSSIPGTYKHLLVVASISTDRAGQPTDRVKTQVGNSTVDTGNNYSTHERYSGSSALESHSGAADHFYSGLVVGGSEAAANMGIMEITFFNYTDTDHHRLVQFWAGSQGVSSFTSVAYGRWENAASAIDIITFTPNLGTNFRANSRMALYGI